MNVFFSYRSFVNHSLGMKMQNNSPDKNVNKEPFGITRRELLVSLMASVGALATMGCTEQFDVMAKTSLAPSGEENDLVFYTQTEYQLTRRLADIIIPETDTLGALAVGVPLLMDKFQHTWASKTSQDNHRLALSIISTELNKLATQDFLTMTGEQQVEILSELDKQAYSSNKNYSRAYRSIKRLMARFYYLSEVGATKELRYEAVPGRWEACVPFEKIGRTWAA